MSDFGRGLRFLARRGGRLALPCETSGQPEIWTVLSAVARSTISVQLAWFFFN